VIKKQRMGNERSTYREIEHTADLGFEITAPDLPALFASAGEALYALIADPATIQSGENIGVIATADGTEELFHGWLSELLALFNVRGFIGKRCEISQLTEEQVVGKISGEKLDLQCHTFRTEIKGVTYHDFKVWQDKGEWHARVIFDV
jgi:SHS2 domain-containing protein